MIKKSEARRIAGEWHGGQNSALYSIASWCGGLLPDETYEAALREVNLEICNFDPVNHEVEGTYMGPYTAIMDLHGLREWLEHQLPSEKVEPRLSLFDAICRVVDDLEPDESITFAEVVRRRKVVMGESPLVMGGSGATNAVLCPRRNYRGKKGNWQVILIAGKKHVTKRH